MKEPEIIFISKNQNSTIFKIENDGYFSVYENKIYILSYENIEITNKIIRHELLHWFLHKKLGSLLLDIKFDEEFFVEFYALNFKEIKELFEKYEIKEENV